MPCAGVKRVVFNEVIGKNLQAFMRVQRSFLYALLKYCHDCTVYTSQCKWLADVTDQQKLLQARIIILGQIGN
jgi:hypothetical protein